MRCDPLADRASVHPNASASVHASESETLRIHSRLLQQLSLVHLAFSEGEAAQDLWYQMRYHRSRPSHLRPVNIGRWRPRPRWGYVGYVKRLNRRENHSRTCRYSRAVTCDSARSCRFRARCYPTMGFRGSRVQIPPSRFEAMLNNLGRPRSPFVIWVNLRQT